MSYEAQRAPFRPWGDFPFTDDDEGDAEVRVPTPGWNQQPAEFNQHPHFDPTTSWGNAQLVVAPPAPAGGTQTVPVLQILDATLSMPAVAMLRLSAQKLDAAVIPPVGPTDNIVWEVLIGVGNSTQTRFYAQVPSLQDGSTNTDINLVMPVQHVAIRATVLLVKDTILERRVQVAAQLAPFTAYPELAR